MDCRSRRHCPQDTPLSEIHTASYSYQGPCCARWTLNVSLRRSPFCYRNRGIHALCGLWTLHHEWLCIKGHSIRLSLIPASLEHVIHACVHSLILNQDIISLSSAEQNQLLTGLKLCPIMSLPNRRVGNQLLSKVTSNAIFHQTL